MISSQNESLATFITQFKRWLDMSKPDAILTADARVLVALKELKLEVPRDIAFAAITVDTGVNPNSDEIGRVAVEALVSRIKPVDRGRPAIPRWVRIEGSRVDGASLPDR